MRCVLVKLIRILPFFFFINNFFLLTGCQTKQLTFKGESELWSAKLKVMQTDDREEKQFVIVYKGGDIESVAKNQITYSFTSSKGSNDGTNTLTKSGVLERGYSACTGCAFLTEDDEISKLWKDISTIHWLKFLIILLSMHMVAFPSRW